MPNMADPYFSRTLTYVCEHNDQGALGIVVNRPIDMTLQALFERLSLTLKDRVTSFALANTVLEKEREDDAIFELASGGFESTVRLAKSNAAMWVPIF